MQETHARSVVKSLSWRVLASITTATLVFIFTGSLALSLGIGVFEFVIKLILYYIHERAWGGVRWGAHNNNTSLK